MRGLISTPAAYHHVRGTHAGRWLVVHNVPGGVQAVDADCPTLDAAEREAAWLNAERDRELRRVSQERALCGLRNTAHLPTGANP